MEINKDLNYSKNLFDNYFHTFIIAEAGSNWKCGSYEEDLNQAKKLIKIASKSGADAVKFQTYKANTVYADKAGKSQYLSSQGFTQEINEIFEYLSMPYEMIPELKENCQKENIIFLSTPFSVEDAKNINPYVPIHKVASFEINHVRLLEYLAKTKKPILISTGASTFDEIDFAVNLIKKYNKSIGLLQCTSKYPSPIESLNLSVIPKMKERYGLPIGFSDHSMDPLIGPLIAVGLGATFLEKHFTIDRKLPGPDHFFSIDPPRLKDLISKIRIIEQMRSDGIKLPQISEVKNRQDTRKSVTAAQDIAENEIIAAEKLLTKRPAVGIKPKYFERIIGKKANKKIKKDTAIQWEDIF